MMFGVRTASDWHDAAAWTPRPDRPAEPWMGSDGAAETAAYSRGAMARKTARRKGGTPTDRRDASGAYASIRGVTGFLG